MADYSSMMTTPQPQSPFGLGGVQPNQQNYAGNPYQQAAGPYAQFGANGGGQGGPIPLGQPNASGTTLAQLSGPAATDDAAKKQLLAKALMSATQSGGNTAQLPMVQNVNGILPGTGT